MKHKALLSASLAALMAVTATAGFPQSNLPLNSLSAAAADDGNDDWLHAKGSRLYDMNGNEVLVRYELLRECAARSLCAGS